MKSRLIILILSVILSSCYPFIHSSDVKGFDPNNYIILSAYEYHAIPVNVSLGEALSGDWDVSPADVITPPFLVFIIDEEHFQEWQTSENFTQAINRFPSESVIYLYDPFFRIDDIPLDNRRSDSFNVKVPQTDTWHLVMYAGLTLFPLTFSWHISVINARLLDIVIYSTVGVIALAITIVFIVIILKRKKISPEEEFKKIIDEEKKKDGALGSLEEWDAEEEQKQQE